MISGLGLSKVTGLIGDGIPILNAFSAMPLVEFLWGIIFLNGYERSQQEFYNK